jgi:gas vesicle protein
MKNKDKRHKAINRSVHKACVPKGLRPETNTDIDAMLDAIGGDKYSDAKTLRMIQKIKGQIPLHTETSKITDNYYEEMTEQENKLLAMHRDGNEEISSDSQKILDEMRKRARKQDEDEENEKE